jgi:predicted RNA-binding protein
MRYLQLALLLLSTVVTEQQAQMKDGVTLRDRLGDAREKLVRKVSSWFVFWGGTTKEDQLKRLDYYLRLARNTQSRNYLNKWQLYKKRWYVWIIDGRMPIKNPDGRVSDEIFNEYIVKVEELIRNRDLTQDEKEFMCYQVQQENERYRRAKHIR